MELTDFTTDELEQELKRRDITPNQLDIPDLTELRRECRLYIDSLDRGVFLTTYMGFISSAAIEALYGPEIWDQSIPPHRDQIRRRMLDGI